jgi:hypothetical protein
MHAHADLSRLRSCTMSSRGINPPTLADHCPESCAKNGQNKTLEIEKKSDTEQTRTAVSSSEVSLAPSASVTALRVQESEWVGHEFVSG